MKNISELAWNWNFSITSIIKIWGRAKISEFHIDSKWNSIEKYKPSQINLFSLKNDKNGWKDFLKQIVNNYCKEFNLVISI